MATPGLVIGDAPEFFGRREEPANSYVAPKGEHGFDFDVAIVGLGYVGLPTALAFHAAGSRVLGVDVSERRLAVIRDEARRPAGLRSRAAARRARRSDRLPYDQRRHAVEHAPPQSSSACRHRSTTFWCPTCPSCEGACATVVEQRFPGRSWCSPRPPTSAPPGTCWSARSPTAGLIGQDRHLRGLQPRADRPGQRPARARGCATGARRGTPHLRRQSRRGAAQLRQERARGRLDRRRGDDQAAGEHLPGGEHRAGERVRRDLQRHGHGRHRRHRRRSHQALWLHGVLPGPGGGRTLHSLRPALPAVAAAAGAAEHPGHRAGHGRHRRPPAPGGRRIRETLSRARSAACPARGCWSSALPTSPTSRTCASHRHWRSWPS